MRDQAVVISARKDWAEVLVTPEAACHDCSARSFCRGQQGADGKLTVFNPMRALPGDRVFIEVPETGYNRELIRLFGFLLLFSLLGMGFGYLAASFLPVSSSESSLFGFLLGLVTTGAFLIRYFRKPGKKNFYPVIIEIIQKGEAHG